jgi:hypothetical protein
MYLYETHMHTAPVSACASSSPARQVQAYKKRGYAGIIVTDHFINGNSGCPSRLPWEEKIAFFISGYERAKAEGELCGLDVFFGFEYNVNGLEFLTYGITPEILLSNPGMDRLSAASFSAFVRENGGYLAQAHPFRSAVWISNPGPAEPGLMDGMEVLNASMDNRTNNKALEFARRHGLAMQAGSDSHHFSDNAMSGISLSKKASNIFDIIYEIKSGTAELIK